MLKTFAIGHLGKDAVVNQVNGKTVINFNVAHSESYKDAQGNKKTNTTWVNCSYWTDRTAIAPYLLKGQQIFVEGIPSVDTYTNNDRQTIAQLRLRVERVQLLGSANRDGQQPQQPQPQNQTNSWNSQSEDEVANDLPF